MNLDDIAAKHEAYKRADRMLVDALLDIDEGLSRGTVAFLESIAEQLDEKEVLTVAQRARCEDIAREHGVSVTRRPE